MITTRTFIHRALIQRNTAGAADPYGNQGVENFTTHIASLRCRYWIPKDTGSLRESSDTSKSAIVIDARLIVPKGTDITEADRILWVKDRNGTMIVSRPLGIDGIARRKDHLELLVQEVRSG